MEFPLVNDRPMIGVMVVMSDKKSLGKYSLPSTYVRSIQASGARVVPIFPNRTNEYYDDMFQKLNGLLVVILVIWWHMIIVNDMLK